MDLQLYQYALIAIVFVWSGFVRSGLGFGGALFTIPFLLLIHDDPLWFLPIISLHLIFFASLTFIQTKRQTAKGSDDLNADIPRVNWKFVRYSMSIMILPKIAGVIGLIILPKNIMNILIFTMISGYSITYILGKPFKSNNRWLDTLFLIVGAYVSGTSLIGGPLVIAVALRHIKTNEFRHTLFVLWMVLVSIKLVAFGWVGVPLNFVAAIWLLPFASVGHVIGHKLHLRLMTKDVKQFYQIIGWILLLTAGLGLHSALE